MEDNRDFFIILGCLDNKKPRLDRMADDLCWNAWHMCIGWRLSWFSLHLVQNIFHFTNAKCFCMQITWTNRSEIVMSIWIAMIFAFKPNTVQIKFGIFAFFTSSILCSYAIRIITMSILKGFTLFRETASSFEQFQSICLHFSSLACKRSCLIMTLIFVPRRNPKWLHQQRNQNYVVYFESAN